MRLILIFTAVIVVWFSWKLRNNYKQIKRQHEIQQAFDTLALHILNTHLSIEEYQKLSAAFRDYRSGLIGRLKQINESIYLATTSKKQDIAESRMAFAIECSDEIKTNFTELLSPYVIKEIDQYVYKAQEQFNTQMYINVSNGYIEKANSLKTTNGKQKYLGLARDVLKSGIDAGKGNIPELEVALYSVNTTITSLD